jgi:hypothetical protein
MGAGPETAGPTFTPTSVTGLVAWWDFSALGLSDGTAISAVPDGSGNNNTLSQATAGLRPLFRTAIQNGRGVARYDGSDDSLDGPAAFGALTGGSMFFVANATHFATARSLSGGSTGSPELRLSLTTGTIDLTKQSTVDYGVGSAVGAAAWHVLEVTYAASGAGGAVAYFVDGTASGTATNANNCNGTLFKVGFAQAGELWLGDIGEALIYNTVVSTPDRQSIETFLKGRWGTP